MRFVRVLLLIAASAAPTASFADTPADPVREKSFEDHVRPLLVKRCGNCHGAEKHQGDLRLDLRTSVLGEKPGEGVVVPGKPDDSRLVQVIRYTAGETQMPPNGKLPADEINILTNWIKDGAYWPEHSAPAAKSSAALPKAPGGQWDFAAIAQTHWAFTPPKPPAPPAVREESRVQRTLDRFVLKQLEASGLTLSPEADRRTLIKRAYFDLIGLPPTFEEVEAFANDPDPAAYEKLVGRLLASPQYGERWGRHWLDVARYADTKGYVFTENRYYPFSFTYRDYVIRSFNEDKPYDQFIREQLAADQLGKPEGDESLAALGFLTVGRRYLNNQQDIIDDRIDVVSRGLLGLSVTCARCHDHKFDPIPTADYYSLYGVFASCNEPEELPLIGKPVESPEYKAYLEEFAKRQKECDDYEAKVYVELQDHLRNRAGDYLQAILKDDKKLPEGVAPAYKDGEPADSLIRRWKQFVSKAKADDPVLGPWKGLAETPSKDFSKDLQSLLDDTKNPINPRLKAALSTTPPPKTVIELCQAYGALFVGIDSEWKTATKDNANPPAQLADADSEQLRRTLYGEGSVSDFPASEAKRYFGRNHRDHLKQLEKKLAQLNVDSPGAPPRAMVVRDNPNPTEPVVFIRGNAGRPGEKVARRFPRIVAPDAPPFKNGSGRLELANAITDKANPLTARVMANRVWLLHFGSALVTSPSDFGVRADAPTNPELLDYLANYFVENNWSIKELHREMLLSSTWKQQSLDRPEARKVDPENQLYWRMNRRRREFESLRDSWLAVSGKLEPQMFGRPVDIEKQPYTGRRTIYELVDRNNLPGLLRTFDFPTPDASSPQRPQTTVPQQALYGMNSAFVQQLADSLAARTSTAPDPETRIDQLFRVALAREATSEERMQFAAAIAGKAFDWPEAAQVLLMSNEFAFVD